MKNCKKMKRIFLLTMTVLLSAGVMLAQEPTANKKQHHSKADKLEHIKTELGLNDEQVEKLKTVFESYKPKAQEIKANTALSDEERREAMKELHKKRQAEMKSILTPEQYEKFKAMKEQHRENGPKGHHKPMDKPHHGGSPNGSK